MATTAGATAAPNPAPVPMKNSFSGLVNIFPNGGIHSVVATAFKFRKQLTVRTEMKQTSGWSNELNVFMMQGLNEISNNVKRITYNSANNTMTELGNAGANPTPNVANPVAPVGGAAVDETAIENKAADITATLQAQFSANAPDVDNLLPPPMPNRQITQVLDGTDLNVPQLDNTNCPNDHFRLFVEGLDNFVVQSTRLDSRNDSSGTISKYESAMMQGILSQLWTICQVFGGEDNKTDVPAGTLPDDETNTFQGGPVFQTGAQGGANTGA